ncbi:plasmid mobilization relaxosome protein MobC [Ferruginibacter sp.]|uniref:plasmid mobilization protein n=1 Tax=Ferruginibacter sp. TaxID=1940288 RepID=UPI002658D931|nr:plasmid mobilization relaxosome protein MobC [Ferruginibacter sp.]
MNMKSQHKKNLGRKVTIRFAEQDYNKINLQFKNSTKQKLSEFIRAVVLDKPITVYTRNQSFDDFLAEMILLRNELKAIGNNFNQSVRKLNAMQDEREIKAWALLNENSKQSIQQKVDEINSKIAQIFTQWSQK